MSGRQRTDADRARRNYVKRLKTRIRKGDKAAEAEWAVALAKRAGKLVIEPARALQDLSRAAAKGPAETFEQFEARGGVVQVLPTFWDTKPGPAPARFPMSAGARAL